MTSVCLSFIGSKKRSSHLTTFKWNFMFAPDLVLYLVSVRPWSVGERKRFGRKLTNLNKICILYLDCVFLRTTFEHVTNLYMSNGSEQQACFMILNFLFSFPVYRGYF
jgi:hypothetical protein